MHASFWAAQGCGLTSSSTLARGSGFLSRSRGFLAAAGHDAALCSDFLLGVTSQPTDQVPAAKALLPFARPAAAADGRPRLVRYRSHRWTRGEPRARRSRTARRGCSKALTPASLENRRRPESAAHHFIPSTKPHRLRCQWHISCCRSKAARKKSWRGLSTRGRATRGRGKFAARCRVACGERARV